MGDNSKIEWCDATWNPFRAKAMREVPDPADNMLTILQEADGYYCEKVSEECKFCYAEKMNRGPWNANGLRYARENRDKARIYVKEKTLLQPLDWKRGRRIFGFSMTDFYGEFHSEEMIDLATAVMALAHWHTFLILTKRADRRLDYLTEEHGMEARRRVQDILAPTGNRVSAEAAKLFDNWPLANVWHGVTAGNKKSWTDRVDVLRRTPTAKRFISVEPLLEDLGTVDLTGIDWVIVGGESGPNARPMHPDWVRSLRDQCAAAGVAFFFKQFGEWAPCGFTNGLGSSSHFHRFTDGQHLEKVGKKAAGRMLDGVEWSQFPEMARG